MMAMSDGYCHVLDGRLRIRITEVKRSASMASDVERMLNDTPGITKAHANPLTGSVLVFFDSKELSHEAVLDKLKKFRCRGYPMTRRHQAESRGVVSWWSDALVRSLTEFALERMVVPLL